MDLRGKTVREVEAGARIRVWYEEEQDGGGKARVAYLGTTTAYSAAEGLRVLFDGYDESEQEVVDAADEWEWAPDLLGPFDAVRLKLRGVGRPKPQPPPAPPAPPSPLFP